MEKRRLSELSVVRCIIHCDKCGLDIPTSFKEYSNFIEQPCPKCDAVLLTAEDYICAEKMFKGIDDLEKKLSSDFIDSFRKIVESDKNPKTFRVQTNGKGKSFREDGREFKT